MSSRRWTLKLSVAVTLFAAAIVAGAWAAESRTDSTSGKTDQKTALTRARREVRLLDDLYKNSIVFVNDTYVEDESSTPAGTVFRGIFEAMKKKGWHDARLIDATGDPINSDNVPRAGFEQQAIKKLLAGETYLEQVVRDGDQEILQAVTVVPVVNNKCLICHPNHKVGDVLGGISYRIPLNDHK